MATCPVLPEDYRYFTSACQLLGMERNQAFAEASMLWLKERCPQIYAMAVEARKEVA